MDLNYKFENFDKDLDNGYKIYLTFVAKRKGERKMDRRSFVKNTAAFATSIPLFNIVRAETLKPVSQRKLRVALIGCGGRMRVLLTKCDKEEIVALVDPDAPQLKRTTDTIYSWGKRTSQNIETKKLSGCEKL